MTYIVPTPVTARRFLLPIRGADPNRRPPPDLDLAAIEGGPDDPVVPVVENVGPDARLLLFSGVEEIRRWREVARFIGAPEDALFALAERLQVAEIVLDAGGPVRRRFPFKPDEARPPMTPNGSFAIRGLAGPLSLPNCDALRTALAAEPVIEAAWVVEATVDDSDVVVLGLEVQGREVAREAIDRLTRAALPLLPHDLYMGMQVVLLEDATVSAAVRNSDAPIYSRL